MNKKQLILYISLAVNVILIAAVIFLAWTNADDKKDSDQDSSTTEISSFAECADAGYPVMESYPAKCKVPEGKTFVEEIDESEDSEVSVANPASTYCLDQGGQLELREDEEGGQTGYCVFANGQECEEWKFYRKECQVTSSSNEETTSPTPTPAEPVTIKVYFFDRDKFNEANNTDYVTAFTRETTRKDMATYAVEQIIAGPTDAEKQQAADDTFGDGTFIEFVSKSTCNGKDFSVSIANGLATVKFCRGTQLTGDMSGMIVTDQIVKTLKQFSTVNKVKVLNSQGYCLNDMSGLSASECVY